MELIKRFLGGDCHFNGFACSSVEGLSSPQAFDPPRFSQVDGLASDATKANEGQGPQSKDQAQGLFGNSLERGSSLVYSKGDVVGVTVDVETGTVTMTLNDETVLTHRLVACDSSVPC